MVGLQPLWGWALGGLSMGFCWARTGLATVSVGFATIPEAGASTMGPNG